MPTDGISVIRTTRGWEKRGSSSPKLLRGEPRAFGHGLELCPADLRVTDSRADAAVRPGDHVFPTDKLGKLHQAIGDGLRVFDEIAVVSHDSRDIYFLVGKFYFLPHTPLMLVAGIGRFNRIGARAHF